MALRKIEANDLEGVIWGRSMSRSEEAILFKRHEKLIYLVACKYFKIGSMLTSEDLLQEARIGLLMAIRRFNPNRGVKFSVYAYPWINRYVCNAVKEKSSFIRIPSTVQYRARNVYGKAARN